MDPVEDVSPRIVEFVGGLIGLPSAAVDQYAQVPRLPDGQVPREGAVGLPTGLCEFSIYLVLIHHLPFPSVNAGPTALTRKSNKQPRPTISYNNQYQLLHMADQRFYIFMCNSPIYFGPF